MNMNLCNINTDRLILIPVTLEITQSLLAGSTKELEKLELHTGDSWPTDDTMDILPYINASLEKEKEPSGFEFWMIVRKVDRYIIGDIGFYGKPNEHGEVTIGFGLVEQARRNGYGSETLRAMVDWLNSQESVKVIKADCLIGNVPSAKILARVGMNEIGRDKEAIYWEYVKPV